MANFILKGKVFNLNTVFLGVFLNLSLIILSTHGQQKIQTIEFYFEQSTTDRCDQGVETSLISFKDEIPDVQFALGVAVDLNTIQQIRVVGAWIVYSEVNFEGKTTIFPNDGCYVLDSSIPVIRSARYFGNSDARKPGLSIFPSQPWPTGNMVYFGESDYEVELQEPICVASWGATGSWTFFSGPNFTGLSKCRRTWGNNGFVQVYSIKQGCGVTLNSNHSDSSLVDIKTPGESRLDIWVSCRPAVIVPITKPPTTNPTEGTTENEIVQTSTDKTTENEIIETSTDRTTEKEIIETSTDRTTENEIVETSTRWTSSSGVTGTTTSEEDVESTTGNSSTPQFQFSTIMSIVFVLIPVLINFH